MNIELKISKEKLFEFIVHGNIFGENTIYEKNSTKKIIKNLKKEQNSLEALVVSKFPKIQKILLFHLKILMKKRLLK